MMIVRHLTKLFNVTILEGQFPGELKEDDVSSLFMKNDLRRKVNYNDVACNIEDLDRLLNDQIM